MSKQKPVKPNNSGLSIDDKKEIFNTRTTPFYFPTAFMARSNKDILLMDFMDGDNERIFTSIALTKTVAKKMIDSLNSFLNNEDEDEDEDDD